MNSPPADLRVRPMTPGDLERVVDIARTLKDAPQWPLAAYLAALDEKALPRRIALVVAGKEAGAVLGFAVARVIGQEAELETIAVTAESQRRGVARRLFAAMAAEMSRAGVQEVLLEVRASNRPALAFYKTLEFAETGRRARYYADPVEDAVMMRLHLA